MKRIKAEEYEVSDPDAAMAKFKSVLGKLVRVPKTEIKASRKGKRAAKRKG